MSPVPEVLIAEDNPDDLALTVRGLARARRDLNVLTFEDGAAITDYLIDQESRPGHAPRLILLDIKMPLMGGLDVLEAVKSRQLCVTSPIVMFSSSQAPRDVACAFASGAQSFVAKPSEYSDYMAVVARIAGYWLGLHRQFIAA